MERLGWPGAIPPHLKAHIEAGTKDTQLCECTFHISLRCFHKTTATVLRESHTLEFEVTAPAVDVCRSAMQRLSLQGPWAYYEQRCAELEAKLQALAHQNQERVQEVNELSRALDAERQRNKDLVECQVPALQNDSATAQAHARRLQERVQELQTVVDTTNETLSTAQDSLSQEVARLQADNTFLKQSLAKQHCYPAQVSLRTAASAKVEQARKHLGMTSPEAEVLIKELDELRAATKSLRAEVAALTADKSHLQQQCSSRSTHAMTLIAENKRVLEQASELRRQTQQQDQDIARLKQELAAAQKLQAKSAARRDSLAAASQARPAWQAKVGGASSPSPQSQQAAAALGPRDITNSDVLRGSAAAKTSGAKATAQRLAGATAGENSAPDCAAAVAGIAGPVLAATQQLEALRARALHQALASRQQRLLTAAEQEHAGEALLYARSPQPPAGRGEQVAPTGAVQVATPRKASGPGQGIPSTGLQDAERASPQGPSPAASSTVARVHRMCMCAYIRACVHAIIDCPAFASGLG
ncbi:hypothetical protein QJQ45_015915 [Haematococcus lacustris]|nr:hypothetical protein QJQ45_015915 [Haematococcus lacustris]